MENQNNQVNDEVKSNPEPTPVNLDNLTVDVNSKSNLDPNKMPDISKANIVKFEPEAELRNHSRRDRKNMMRKLKKMGLIPKHETQKTRAERIHRSRLAGEQMHTQFMMDNEMSIRKQEAEKQHAQFKNLAESFGEEKAREIIAKNMELARKREEKLRSRKNKK